MSEHKPDYEQQSKERRQEKPEEASQPTIDIGELDLERISRMFAEKVGNYEGKAENSMMENTDAILKAIEEPNEGKELYDPSRPNNYEQVLKERELLAEEQRLQSLEEEYNLKCQLYGHDGLKPIIEDKVPIMDQSGPLIDRKIVKMLEKHGWEYGKGMGAEESGMLNPLVAVKTVGNNSVIQPSEGDVVADSLGLPMKYQSVQGGPPQQIQPPQTTVVYHSAPVVDDPRIKPIQDKYFRTYSSVTQLAQSHSDSLP